MFGSVKISAVFSTSCPKIKTKKNELLDIFNCLNCRFYHGIKDNKIDCQTTTIEKVKQE